MITLLLRISPHVSAHVNRYPWLLNGCLDVTCVPLVTVAMTTRTQGGSNVLNQLAEKGGDGEQYLSTSTNVGTVMKYIARSRHFTLSLTLHYQYIYNHEGIRFDLGANPVLNLYEGKAQCILAQDHCSVAEWTVSPQIAIMPNLLSRLLTWNWRPGQSRRRVENLVLNTS